MTKPEDLKPGDQIRAGTCLLTVVAEPFADYGEETARRFGTTHHPEFDRVTVDIEPVAPDAHMEMDALATAAGAKEAQFLKMVPTWRFRLFFAPDADVEVVA